MKACIYKMRVLVWLKAVERKLDIGDLILCERQAGDQAGEQALKRAASGVKRALSGRAGGRRLLLSAIAP